MKSNTRSDDERFSLRILDLFGAPAALTAAVLFPSEPDAERIRYDWHHTDFGSAQDTHIDLTSVAIRLMHERAGISVQERLTLWFRKARCSNRLTMYVTWERETRDSIEHANHYYWE